MLLQTRRQQVRAPVAADAMALEASKAATDVPRSTTVCLRPLNLLLLKQTLLPLRLRMLAEATLLDSQLQEPEQASSQPAKTAGPR